MISGTYSGTAGDGGQGLLYNNNRPFGTIDNDVGTCAAQRGGGFWFNGCSYIGLTNTYYNRKSTGLYGYASLQWYAWKQQEALREVVGKFKLTGSGYYTICRDNGGCEHICTDNGDDTRTCSCNAGYLPDGDSCILSEYSVFPKLITQIDSPTSIDNQSMVDHYFL